MQTTATSEASALCPADARRLLHLDLIRDELAYIVDDEERRAVFQDMAYSLRGRLADQEFAALRAAEPNLIVRALDRAIVDAAIDAAWSLMPAPEGSIEGALAIECVEALLAEHAAEVEWERDCAEQEAIEMVHRIAQSVEERRAAEARAALLAPLRESLVDWSTFWTKDYKSEDWLVEPLLPRGRAVATFSPAKVGKSLLTLDVAARLSTGRPVLDQPAGPPVSVVYCDMEMTEGDVRERLEDMGYGPDDDLSRLHYYVLPSLPPLDTPEGGKMLFAIVEEHDAELLIIDTTSRVISGKENDSDTFRALYQHTGMLLKRRGCTVWRQDHAGKDAEKGQRGSSAKNDDVDLVWQLTARSSGIRLRATHRRQSWVPEIIELERLEGPLRHERASESWPAGTNELARILDNLDLPQDAGRDACRKALREAGHSASNEVLAAAIRHRRSSMRLVLGADSPTDRS